MGWRSMLRVVSTLMGVVGLVIGVSLGFAWVWDRSETGPQALAGTAPGLAAPAPQAAPRPTGTH